jgi:hypothetical protein
MDVERFDEECLVPGKETKLAYKHFGIQVVRTFAACSRLQGVEGATTACPDVQSVLAHMDSLL